MDAITGASLTAVMEKLSVVVAHTSLFTVNNKVPDPFLFRSGVTATEQSG
jgi:hypothetical protein